MLFRLALLGGVVFLIWRYWDHETFREWKREAGPVPFFAALAILPAIGVPTTPFYVLAGATFGIPVSLLGSLAALAFNLTLCYWISRGPFRYLFEKWLVKTRRELPTLERHGAWRLTLVIKFMPGVPPVLKHYFIVLAGVPFAIYFSASMVISGFYAAGFIVLGDSALDRNPTPALIVLGVLALASGLVWWFRSRGEPESRE